MDGDANNNVEYMAMPGLTVILPCTTYVKIRARSETVYAGMVYRHFFRRLEIIPPLLSGRLPYRYALHEI